MRINDRLLVQQVDDLVVFVDLQTNSEVTYPLWQILDVVTLMSDAAPDQPVTLTAPDETVVIHPAEFAWVSHAIGYFVGLD